MTTLDSTPAAAVLVAIDIAKVHNEFLIEAPATSAGVAFWSLTPVPSTTI